MTEQTEQPWHRLTDAQALDFLTMTLILTGHDPNNELVIGGNPKAYLCRIVKEIGQLKPDETNGKHCIQTAKLLSTAACIIDTAQLIGYSERTTADLAEYLRTLPKTGTIGNSL